LKATDWGHPRTLVLTLLNLNRTVDIDRGFGPYVSQGVGPTRQKCNLALAIRQSRFKIGAERHTLE
jgi:hypothetical protein